MDRSKAAALAQRLCDTWPGSITTRSIIEVWTDELEHLDEGTVGTVLVRLRRTETNRPSIAEFHAHYRNTMTAANDPIGGHCATCDGSGWQITTPQPTVVLKGHRDDVSIGVVKPCNCRNGRRRDEPFQRARILNDKDRP